MSEKILVLPKPSGPFHVGRMHLNFVDDTREDHWNIVGGGKRDIPLLIWYPSNETTLNTPLNYLSPKDFENFQKVPLFQWMPKKMCDVLTNSYEGAAFTDKFQNFPVLLFNHGLSGYMEQNTILIEHLASYGYIIVSIGHPHGGIASYPDGRSIPFDIDLFKDSRTAISTEEANKKEKEYRDQINRPDITVDEMKVLTQNYLLKHEVLNQQIEVWVEDVLFILDKLEDMNSGTIPSQIKGKLALEKGNGLFGHSYGGGTSILARTLDERFTCAIKIDGILRNGLHERYNNNKPCMYMYNSYIKQVDRYFYTINQNDSYTVIVQDTTHYDFADSYILKKLLKKNTDIYGKIDANEMITILNDYVLAFFNKYLKGMESPLLETNPYTMVAFEKHF